MGWNDDGFDDWNFDDVKEEKKVESNNNKLKDSWAPPAPE